MTKFISVLSFKGYKNSIVPIVFLNLYMESILYNKYHDNLKMKNKLITNNLGIIFARM